ncbi:MAG: MFS transporter [Candidatus Heimdallarchaeota archaeon]
MSAVVETDSAVAIEEKPSIKEVLKNKAYMVLFSAQFIENIGRAISGLAIEFLIYELTGSPFLMGILGIIWLSPFVIIAPFAGVITDRFDQRKIMFYANIGSFIASLGFVIIYLLRNILIIITTTISYQPSGFGGEVLVTTTHTNYVHFLWPLFVLCFLNSAAAAFFFPARNAYTRYIVKKKNLLVANSIGSTVFQIATIVGYVLAGILAATSYLGSFIFDACTFLVSGLLIILMIRITSQPPEVVREKKSFRGEMKEFKDDLVIGYRTLREYPKISYMFVVFSAITFTFGAINVLFIVVLQGQMGLDQTWYGIIQALMGASGIITAIVMMSLGKINRKILLLNLALAAAAGVMYLFATVRILWILAIVITSFGVISVAINIPSSTLIQETIPYEKQGRVFGTQQLIQGIAQLIGMGIVSLIADFVGTNTVLLAAAIICTVVIVVGFIYSSSKGLMGSDYPKEIADKTPESTLVKSGATPATTTYGETDTTLD